MSMLKTILAEFEHEAGSTRRMLERIPTGSFGFRPHEKSNSLGQLAAHVVELYRYLPATLEQDELDFAKMPAAPRIETSEELMAAFEQSLAAGKQALQQADDEMLAHTWTMRRGEQVFFTIPKKVALRSFIMNHIVHHRGQLAVYLRLCGIPVPGMYGLSGDEKRG